MSEKINAIKMSRSLTGFDEIAIKKLFGSSFEKLEGMFAGRSLWFIKLRREGVSDKDAFKAAMDVTIGELEDVFDSTVDAEGNDQGSTQTETSIEPTQTL